ncbi:hypothetical protein ACHHYP_10432 [Achlya hypogyna]|uniref:Transmembrane protein n=1 Tax=Achlya hypogyna TaxID=1202772 RepID=A0A1V9YLF5_ACHHY|nr:hypothetical protein ACHHYP_10432 [Achlya hypogyna]
MNRSVCLDTTCWSALCLASPADANWTLLCAVPVSATWSCCGYSHYHQVFPILLWVTFVLVTIVFHRRSSIFTDIVLSVDDLHDIRTQALGVVVARQKRVIFGKARNDPRRLFMLVAMWFELIGFSYIPVQLLVFQYTSGSFVGQFSGATQWAKFIAFSLLLIALEVCPLHWWPPRWVQARDKQLVPLLYDLCYTTYLYAVIDFGGCWNGVDNVHFLDGTSCASSSRYWVFPTLATVVFVLLYWGTLDYKLRLSDDIYSVQFRYHASFNGIITMARTLGSVGFYTVEKCLLFLDPLLVSACFSVINLITFATLLAYNFTHQPCLGVGYLPNNLRSLSFATACYVSVLLGVVSVVQMCNHRTMWGFVESTLVLGWAGLYPVFAIIIWRWNGRRALQYQVPNQPLLELLRHANYRVRAVAAVSMVLEEVTIDTPEIRALLLALDTTLHSAPSTDHGRVSVYTCQAMWHLWRHRFERVDTLVESKSEACCPFGLWVKSRFSGPSLALVEPQVSRHRNSSPRRSRRISDVASQLGRKASLGQLVEQTTCRHGIFGVKAPISIDAGMFRCLSHTITVLTALIRIDSAKTRFVAAKIMFEMYQARHVRLTRDSMVRVAITRMASAPRLTDATSAAETLLLLLNEEVTKKERMRLLVVAFTDQLTALHLTEALACHVWEASIVVELLRLLIDALTTFMLDDAGVALPPPMSYLSKPMVRHLVTLQSKWPANVIFGMVDHIFVVMRQCCKRFEARHKKPSYVFPKSAHELMERSEYKVVVERQRTRVDVLASVQWILAEGFAGQKPPAQLSLKTRRVLQSVSTRLATHDTDLLAYLESNLSEPQCWYLGGLVGGALQDPHDVDVPETEQC